MTMQPDELKNCFVKEREKILQRNPILRGAIYLAVFESKNGEVVPILRSRLDRMTEAIKGRIRQEYGHRENADYVWGPLVENGSAVLNPARPELQI